MGRRPSNHKSVKRIEFVKDDGERLYYDINELGKKSVPFPSASKGNATKVYFAPLKLPTFEPYLPFEQFIEAIDKICLLRLPIS